MTPIDPKTYIVVDLATCDEIKGAIALDTDTLNVVIAIKNYGAADTTRTDHFPSGVRVVRRR